jgi:hypothetical protein
MLRFRYKNSIDITISYKSVSVPVKFVEKNKDFIFGQLADLQVFSQYVIKIVNIESASVLFDTVEKFEAICNIKILSHSQFSSFTI